mmetsp:Transcript_69140/g.192464  ORF Transcript_69140/g.192464 Transcript_69140/m.192464 type:complete len:259 (-) Transcript_69140:23-799(-)
MPQVDLVDFAVERREDLAALVNDGVRHAWRVERVDGLALPFLADEVPFVHVRLPEARVLDADDTADSVACRHAWVAMRLNARAPSWRPRTGFGHGLRAESVLRHDVPVRLVQQLVEDRVLLCWNVRHVVERSGHIAAAVGPVTGQNRGVWHRIRVVCVVRLLLLNAFGREDFGIGIGHGTESRRHAGAADVHDLVDDVREKHRQDQRRPPIVVAILPQQECDKRARADKREDRKPDVQPVPLPEALLVNLLAEAEIHQ